MQVSSGVEKSWMDSNKLDVMRGINPGEAGVPIYSYNLSFRHIPLSEFFQIQFVRLY